MDDAKAPAGSVNKEVADVNKENPETHVLTEHDHHSDMLEQHSIIGVSLVTGFIFMLLVDQLGGSMHSHSVPPDPESTGHTQNRNKITATLGLVVHAAGLCLYWFSCSLVMLIR